MPFWTVVIVLGIVEGITEFLPISSTAHLLLTERLLKAQQSVLFNVVIQCGAVLAVIPLFPVRIRQFLNWRQKAGQLYLAKLLLAFVLTAIGGYILDKRGWKLEDNPEPIAVALFLGGVGFIIVEQWLQGRNLGNEVSWAMAIAVGLGQLLAAAFPGTSRSGVTILFCLCLGLNRVAATEFCFLVGIPTMLAAGAWHMVKLLRHQAPGTAPENWEMLMLGCVVSAIVSFIAVKWLLRYIQTHTFVLFGWYRIAVAAVIAILHFYL